MGVAGGVNLQEGTEWQSNPSLCGPASIANALRSLGETATSETAVLAGTGRCWTGVCFMGLTLDELGKARLINRTVSVLRDLSPEQFQQHLRRSNEPGRRYIINFSRKEIFGAGAGHHSPIGGYLEAGGSGLRPGREPRFYQPGLSNAPVCLLRWTLGTGKRNAGLLLIK